MTLNRMLVLLMMFAMTLVACASDPTPQAQPILTTATSEAPTTAPTEGVPATAESAAAAPTEAPAVVPTVETVARPAWQQIELVNATTGETFTLADFAGKTVFVEPMATWCTNCRAQLGRVREVRQQLGEENYAFIGLSLETNLSAGDLADYQRETGYDWTFAVMSIDMLRQLESEFGRSVTVAPSTPHFVIRPDGSFTPLRTGAKSIEQIAQEMITESGV
ncbi:MAG: hypothetical protein OHK0046_04710 [Anaerolineae bacterium]